MPFGRLHEEAAGDSKLLALSDAAWRMWGMGLIYCQKNLTDGFIPEQAVVTFGVRGFDIDRALEQLETVGLPKRFWSPTEGVVRKVATTPRSAATELCTPQVPGRSSLWERVDGGYQVHDYLDWNDSKDEILKKRAEGRERVNRWRERHKSQTGEHPNERNALQANERDAHESGTWYVERSSEGVQGKPLDDRRNQPRRQTDGVFSSALPRHHLNHAACSPNYAWCIAAAVHAKLEAKLSPKFAGDRQAAGHALQAWYPRVWTSLPADFVMRDDFRFWEGRFDQEFATKEAPPARQNEPQSNVPSAAETRRRQQAMREGRL